MTRLITLLLGVLFIFALPGCYKAPALPISDNPYFQRGFSYAAFTRDVFLSAESDKSLDRMITAGTDWVALIPIWYQDDRYSTIIYPKAIDTPSDESERYAIRYLQESDVDVMLKPHVDCEDGT